MICMLRYSRIIMFTSMIIAMHSQLPNCCAERTTSAIETFSLFFFYLLSIFKCMLVKGYFFISPFNKEAARVGLEQECLG